MCQNGRKQIVAWTMDGVETVLAKDAQSNDLCLNAKGEIWFTDPENKRVWFLDTKGNKRVVHEGIERPNGVLLSTDQTLLMVNDSRGKWVWSFSVNDDGTLTNGQAFHRLETPEENGFSGADGMTIDTDGHLYVTSRIGLQVCDQAGRVVAILNKPHAGSLSNAVFGGPDLSTLYVTAGDRVYKREIKRKGVYSWAPVKPPMPRL